MKKITFILVLLVYSLSSIGQEKVKINIGNPSPRVGDKISFIINIDFFNSFLKKNLEQKSLVQKEPSYGFFSKTLSREIIFKEAKEYTIGPFKFEFNGKKYITNSIIVKVLPELPKKTGLWVRYAKSDDEQYIIIEQLIKNVPNKPNDGSEEYTHYLGGVKPDDKEFAKLNTKLTKGIQLSQNGSMTKTVNDGIENINTLGFSYSRIKYKVEFDKDFKGRYKISDKDFNNLPKLYTINIIELKQ